MTIKNKTGCIVQGNYRQGTELVLRLLADHFDYVCFSTWEESSPLQTALPGNVEVLRNKRPESSGYTNRNLQRVSTIAGIRACRIQQCEFVLKWRSDMLPTRIDVSRLIEKSLTDVPSFLLSRLVIAPTRTRSVSPDWYSSISDFFHFGHIDMVEMLWDDEGFDFSKMFNPPPQMLDELGMGWVEHMHGEGAYFCAEQELYAWFKFRLQKRFNVNMDHGAIARTCCCPDESLGVCWFGPKFRLRPLSIGFRPIEPGLSTQWWRAKHWRGSPTTVFSREEIDRYEFSLYLLMVLHLPYLLAQIAMQHFYFFRFKHSGLAKERK